MAAHFGPFPAITCDPVIGAIKIPATLEVQNLNHQRFSVP